ncbi:MAG: FMN-dependent NADH-azoreductase, partial [Bacillus sp. (in: firmicutes)]
YKESHPEDTITELDLFQENLPYYGVNQINGMYKQANGFELTDEEQVAANTVNKYLNQFLEADKVVFAFPLWNFTVPSVLHTYMDYLSQAGKTFKYTAEGPVGLAGDKKVVLLVAKGGVYSEGPAKEMDLSERYVKTLLGFWGIQDTTTIVIEGHNQYADRAEEIIQAGLQQAATTAQAF